MLTPIVPHEAERLQTLFYETAAECYLLWAGFRYCAECETAFRFDLPCCPCCTLNSILIETLDAAETGAV